MISHTEKKGRNISFFSITKASTDRNNNEGEAFKVFPHDDLLIKYILALTLATSERQIRDK